MSEKNPASPRNQGRRDFLKIGGAATAAPAEQAAAPDAVHAARAPGQPASPQQAPQPASTQ